MAFIVHVSAALPFLWVRMRSKSAVCIGKRKQICCTNNGHQPMQVTRCAFTDEVAPLATI
ncbi:MAG: hypothetical protein H7228_16540 [Polaromonas sp.]|nr:hypothetical protein [Polaromonas sp.]